MGTIRPSITLPRASSDPSGRPLARLAARLVRAWSRFPALTLWLAPPANEHPALHPYDRLPGDPAAARPPRRLFLRGKILELR